MEMQRALPRPIGTILGAFSNAQRLKAKQNKLPIRSNMLSHTHGTRKAAAGVFCLSRLAIDGGKFYERENEEYSRAKCCRTMHAAGHTHGALISL